MADLSAAVAPRLRPLYRLQWEEAQQAWVLLYPEGMVRLNPPAAEILRRCDGAASPGAIAADLERVFNTTGLIDDVEEFLTEARSRGWIEFAA